MHRPALHRRISVATAETTAKKYYLVLLSLLTLLPLLSALLSRYLSHLRHIPGPLLASCTRLWKTWAIATTHQEVHLMEAHRKYGPVVRIAPDQISVAHPTAARDVLTAGRGFHKTDFYTVCPPVDHPEIFTEVRENVHAQKKRVVAPAYSLNSMQKLSKPIEETIQLLFTRIDEHCEDADQHLDLGIWLHYFCFDVLGEVAFSKRFGFLENGNDVEGVIKTVTAVQRYNGIVGQIPFLDKLLRNNPVWKFVPFVDRRPPLTARMAWDNLMTRQKSGNEGHSGQEDLLSQLLKGSDAYPDRFDKGDVFAVLHGAIMAGADSTASTLQSFLHCVLRSPRVCSKLLGELVEADAKGNLSRPPMYEQCLRLSYFQACLKETMRLRPAFGIAMERRVANDEGAVIDGKWYPYGTKIAINSWVVHRDKNIFGADAEDFRPERWLESDEQAKRMDRYMVHFGGGAHVCIGRNLALLEINKILPMLLLEFDIGLVNPERDLECRNVFFAQMSGLHVRIKRKNL